MLGNTALSEAPLSAYPVTEPLVFAETDIILRPVPAGFDICLWPPLEIDDCPPVVPPKPSGPAGGMVYWRGDGPVNRGRRSPWERSKTLAPTRRRTKQLEVDPDADDLEVVEILTHWLGRL